ncbi:ABC transporter permease [Nocardia terpenica]|uniref:Sugar ABC transporter permease n=1 Tax=Nocardia terpenica TaxID=455432 RepID=A0A164ICX7_9NOCA|nr:sugar ABC transporter permease [Nocardia terpenica]
MSASVVTTAEPVADPGSLRRAVGDLAVGLRQRQLWLVLGWQDIKQRYRRSVLGPFWITISTGLQATAMGLFYALFLHRRIDEYLPYVTVGLLVWNLIYAAIVEGAEVFIANEGLIKQLPSALSVHVYRLVWRHLLFFAHNLVIYAVMVAVFGIWRHLNWTVLLAIPAMAVLTLNAVWVAIVFGILSTRFRDISLFLGSTTLMLFVLTPVTWPTDLAQGTGAVAERLRFVELIPTYHYLAIIRAPLLGEPLPVRHWYIVGVITLAGWALAVAALTKYRARVPYWV